MNRKILAAVIAATLAVGFYLLFYYDPAVIDEAYISTEAFRSLENKLETEENQEKEIENVLKEVAADMLRDPAIPEFSLPYTQKLDASASEGDPPLLNRMIRTPHGSRKYGFRGIGRSVHDTLSLLWYTARGPAPHREMDFILATARGETIADVQKVATFRKTISEEITGRLQIDSDLSIRVEVRRIRYYPIRQEYRSNYRYTIGQAGRISSRNPWK